MLKLMMLKVVTVYTVNIEAKSTKGLMIIIIIVLYASVLILQIDR